MEKVTVVIPNYNGEKYLEPCLRSILNQEPDTPPYQVVVIDNGSRDGSLELLKRLFPQVNVIAFSKNTGFCHAVNAGIMASAHDSPYVILLNNDTKAAPGFVKGLYHALEAHPRAFSVSAAMLMWDREELLDDGGDRYCALGWAYGRGKGRPAASYSRPCEVFSACGGAAIYRRSVLDQIGLFDEAHFAYLEDLDMGWRARIYGYHNYYEPSAQVIHYGSASTGSRYNEKKTVLAAANNIYVIGKNMPSLQIFLNLPFLIPGFLIKFLFFCKKGMGHLYLKGLAKGVDKLFSAHGRQQRVPFRFRNLGNYLVIQLQLWLNLIRFLKKS